MNELVDRAALCTDVTRVLCPICKVNNICPWPKMGNKGHLIYAWGRNWDGSPKCKDSPSKSNKGNQMENLKAQWVLITPNVAEQYLKKNIGNRPISRKNVDKLRHMMRSGEWMTNGDTICFSRGGRLLNGQHRLTACVEEGFSYRSLVVHGLDEDVFKTYDQGKARTAEDMISMLGENLAAEKSTTCNNILRYKARTEKRIAEHFPRHDIVEFFESNKEKVSECVTYCKSWPGVMSRAFQAALLFLFAEKDEDQAFQFMDMVVDGVGLKKGDPALSLRQRLVREATKKTELPTNEKMALCIIAWNLFREGRKSKSLRWASGANQKFPSIK